MNSRGKKKIKKKLFKKKGGRRTSIAAKS